MDLATLFNSYGSDKDINGYSPLYHILFDKKREDPMNVLEIGIGTMIPQVPSSMVGYALPNYSPGGSLRAWRDFFTKSQIYGFDVQPDTQFQEDRITTRLCNSTSAEDVGKTLETLGNIQFDIIIDDGDHWDVSQYQTLRNFYPHLKPGGIYIIEDVYVGSGITENPREILSIVNNDPFFFSGYRNNLCVIYKQPLSSMYRAF